MGERLTYRVYKGCNVESFRSAFERIASHYGGAINWNTKPLNRDRYLHTRHDDEVHTAFLPYLSGADSLFCFKVGAELSVPWLEIRIQDGSLWDFNLFAGEKHLDGFSTLPEYWEDDQYWIATQRGNPQLLADTWQLDVARISKYLLPWGMVVDEDEGVFHTVLEGKAYPDDQFDYGDIWQMSDFLRALGVRGLGSGELGWFEHDFDCPSRPALEGKS